MPLKFVTLRTALANLNAVKSHYTDEFHADIADAYHRLGLLQRRQNLHLDAVKSLQEEIRIRQNVAPNDYTALYENVASVYADVPSNEAITAMQHAISKDTGPSSIKLILKKHAKLVSLNKLDDSLFILHLGIVSSQSLSDEVLKKQVKELYIKSCYTKLASIESADKMSVAMFEGISDLVTKTYTGRDYVSEMVKLFTVYLSDSSRIADLGVVCYRGVTFLMRAIYTLYCDLKVTDQKAEPYVSLFECIFKCIQNQSGLLSPRFNANLLTVAHLKAYFPQDEPQKFGYLIELYLYVAEKFAALIRDDSMSEGSPGYNAKQAYTMVQTLCEWNAITTGPYVKRIFELNLYCVGKRCDFEFVSEYTEVFDKLAQNLTSRILSDEESLAEWLHLAERCNGVRKFGLASEAYENALVYCLKLYPGNNFTTAELLQDIGIAYKSMLDDKYEEYERKYEHMIQCIRQGIQ